MKKLFLLMVLLTSFLLSYEVQAQTAHGTFAVDTLTMSSSVDSMVRYFAVDFDATAPEGYVIDLTVKTQRVSGTPVIVMYPEFTNFDGGKTSSLSNASWARDWGQKDTLQIVTGTFSQNVNFTGRSKYVRVVFRGSGTGVYYVTPSWCWRKKTAW